MPGTLANPRIVTDEWMDSPHISATDHLQALAGLRRINRISGPTRHIVPQIVNACTGNPTRISMLDIACGGGDVPIAVAKQLRPHGIEVDLTLFDRSSTALNQAAASAQAANISCRAVPGEALSLADLSPVDVVTNSLFLHHLRSSEEVIFFLSSVRRLARRIVIISDLVRSRSGLLGAWVGCRILSRSPIVHHDGPASVRAAWTVDELRELANQAGMHGASLRHVWPCRMLLVWKPPGE